MVTSSVRSASVRRWCCALASAFVCSLTASARAEVVAHLEMFGHDVRVEREPGGALSLTVPGEPPVRLSAGGRVTAQVVTLAGGLAWVARVDADPPAAAVVVASAQQRPTALFAGPLVTGGEDPGERRRVDVIVRDLSGHGTNDVVIAERRDEVRLCGAGRPLVSARAIHPQTLRLASVTLNPLRADLVDGALPIARAIHALAFPGTQRAALSALTFTWRTSGSMVNSGALGLTDRSNDTAITFRTHEFATATAVVAGLPVDRVVITAPAAPARLPSTFVLFTQPENVRLDVTLPPGITVRPGERIAIPIVPARPLECLALVVTDSSGGAPMAIADVELFTDVDREPAQAMTRLIAALSGARGDEVAQLLGAMGEGAIAPLALALPTLDVAGARRAVRVLASSRAPTAAPALVGAMGRTEVRAEATEAVVRLGALAIDALGAATGTDAGAVDVIAAIRAPIDVRLRAIVPALRSDIAVWRAARRSALELVRVAARAGSLDPWLTVLPTDALSQSRGLALAADAANDAAQRAAVAVRARAVEATSFDDRYRLLSALAGDDEGAAQVENLVRADPDADLRAEAVRVLGVAHRGRQTVVRALDDRVPRVRASAAVALGGDATARGALARVIERDSWPSVRARAVSSVGPEPETLPILLRALDDVSVVVVRAVLEMLTRSRATGFGLHLIEYAEDSRRNPELRQDALGVLQARCERVGIARLERIASTHLDPALPPPEQSVGLAALAALAHIDPARARAFLRSSEANAVAVAAVQRASRSPCPAR